MWSSRPPAASGRSTSIPAAEGADHFSDRSDLHQVSSLICAQLLFLESENRRRTSRSISTASAVVTAGLAVYDTMQYIRSRFHGVAWAWRLGRIAVADRRREGQALRVAEQPGDDPPAVGGAQGQATDIRDSGPRNSQDAGAAESDYVHHTGRNCRRSRPRWSATPYLSAEEARDFGLVDEVVASRPTSASDSPAP